MECQGITSCWFGGIRLLITYRPGSNGFQLETVTLWQSVHRNLHGILEKLPKTLDESNVWETMTYTGLA